jgi:hypothetical protein
MQATENLEVSISAPGWALPLGSSTHPTPSVEEQRNLIRAALQGTLAVIRVNVTNTGTIYEGDEVVFLFANVSGTPTVQEHRRLVGYERVSLGVGESKIVSFNVTAEMLSSVGDDGSRYVLSGEHGLIFSRGHGDELEAPRLNVVIGVGQAVPCPQPNRVVISSIVPRPLSREIDTASPSFSGSHRDFRQYTQIVKPHYNY